MGGLAKKNAGSARGGIDSRNGTAGRGFVRTGPGESEGRYRRLVQNMRDGFASVDGEGRIIDANPAFARLVGYTIDELRTMICQELTPERWHAFEATVVREQLAARGYSDLYEKEYIRKDGTIVPVEVRVHEIRVHGSGFVSSGDGGEGRMEAWTFVTDITRRKQAEEAVRKREKELETRSAGLEEANTALKVLIRHREEDKRTLEATIVRNIRELVFPYIDKLKRSPLNEDQKVWLDIIESGLEGVISPFLRNMASLSPDLTATEVRVADLIKNGKTSKEISELLRISQHTADRHRNNIRTKLGLANKKINLQAFLISLQ